MTENELLSELIRELGEELPALDAAVEVTAQMVADATNKNVDKMRVLLDKRVTRGELEARWVRTPTGHRARAYRKA